MCYKKMYTTQKIWQSSYPQGIPTEVQLDKYTNLGQMYQVACQDFSKQQAFENMGERLSYGEVFQYAEQFAAYLQQDCGLVPGNRIVIQMPNLLQYPVILFAALRAGLIVVSTNPLYTAEEMHHQFKDAQIHAIVILENFADKLEAVLKKGLPTTPQVIITRIGDLSSPLKGMMIHAVLRYVKKMIPKYKISQSTRFRRALKRGAQLNFIAPEVKSTDLAFLQYTGGTTGTPKGAMLSHGNVLSNIAQVKPWIKDTITRSEETIITALPLYHIFALTCNCLLMFHLGHQNILITNPRDMKSFLSKIATVPFSLITGVNTLFKGMMQHPYFEKIDFSKLKISIGGGMALQRSVSEAWEQRTRCPLIEGYGLSETSPVLSLNPTNGHHKAGSIGLLVSDTELRLLDDQDQDVTLGEIGEICVKGPQVTSGYWRQEKETQHAFHQGYFRTGDLATMDTDGFIYIVDRKKEMIIVSGLKAYPNQIEEVIAAHPQVQEVGVRGLPDPDTGEAVHAFVIKKDDSLSEDTLRKYCKEKLAPYKIPKRIHFKTELPKSNVGKILRRHLSI